ncbi:MAG: cell division protein FtsQ [Cyclobacteriaceae bacterium]
MKDRIKQILSYSFGLVLVISLISFASKRQSDRYVSDLNIDIEVKDGYYFVDQQEVVQLINAESEEYVLGLTLDQLDLKELERRVEENSFVRDAQVYLDIKGSLKIQLEQTRPLARLINYKNQGDRYVDEDGNLLPLNSKHTARVPLVELETEELWESNLFENDLGADLMHMFKYIDQDEFWKAQIAHMIVDPKKEITMLPQVTKQEIQFGSAREIEQKFRKLKVFYKQILPTKGWNTYAYVNVKYNNQIVCK